MNQIEVTIEFSRFLQCAAYHRCRECNTVYLLDQRRLVRHLHRHHAMTVADYTDRHNMEEDFMAEGSGDRIEEPPAFNGDEEEEDGAATDGEDDPPAVPNNTPNTSNFTPTIERKLSEPFAIKDRILGRVGSVGGGSAEASYPVPMAMESEPPQVAIRGVVPEGTEIRLNPPTVSVTQVNSNLP